MSFKVYLHTFAKRDNSTKVPTVTGTEFSCVLKSGSGIMHPVLSFDLGIAGDPSQYNYAYIPAFERYYFIEEWYFNRALWTATLKVDVLATYKTEIGNSSLYIMRAAGAHDGNIIDTLYPAKAGCSFASDTKSNPWNTTGLFIVGVVTAEAAFGSLNYYAMDAGQLRSLCLNLTDPSTIITAGHDFDLTELSTGLQLSLVDPIQYVKSCIMLPVAASDITPLDAAASITVYRFASMGTGRRITPPSRINKSYSFTIPKHPDTNSRGNYLNSAPYTNITLTIPPFGCIDIDSSVTCNASTLTVNVEVDPVTGKGIMEISCNNIILNRLEAQIGVPISLSSVTRDYVGAATSAIGAIGGAVGGAMSAGLGGAFLGAASGVGNAVESLMPRANTIGTTGTFAANHGSFRLDCQFFRPVADDNTHNGRPLCEVRQISSLSGYMIIQDGDVTINGTSAEDSMIRNYLETGFYYE
ncbi:MAG: hypothetical protein IKB93_05010 [Clostridia bacterium]|nr:hypothetical protein [Clostridia bacterium]